MNNNTFDRSSLRISAMLLLVALRRDYLAPHRRRGQPPLAIFAAYADSATWTAVHVAQFACMAIMLAGLFGLLSAVEVQAGVARLAARPGAASTTATLALYSVVLAVDGVALK